MVNMCSLRTPYRCINCNQDMLFFTTNKNILVDYKGLMSDGRDVWDVKKYLKPKKVRKFKCMSCGSVFTIDWTNSFPEPILEELALNKLKV